jgi:hypothetical protein
MAVHHRVAEAVGGGLPRAQAREDIARVVDRPAVAVDADRRATRGRRRDLAKRDCITLVDVRVVGQEVPERGGALRRGRQALADRVGCVVDADDRHRHGSGAHQRIAPEAAVMHRVAEGVGRALAGAKRPEGRARRVDDRVAGGDRRAAEHALRIERHQGEAVASVRICVVGERRDGHAAVRYDGGEVTHGNRAVVIALDRDGNGRGGGKSGSVSDGVGEGVRRRLPRVHGLELAVRRIGQGAV